MAPETSRRFPTVIPDVSPPSFPTIPRCHSRLPPTVIPDVSLPSFPTFVIGNPSSLFPFPHARERLQKDGISP